MLNLNYRKTAIKNYQAAVSLYNDGVHEANAASERANAAIQHALFRLKAFGFFLGSLRNTPMEFKCEVKNFKTSRSEITDRNYDVEAFEKILVIGGAIASSATLTVVGSQVAKRVLISSTKTAAVRVCGVALKSAIGPIGWITLGCEIVYGGYSVRKKNQEQGDEALKATYHLSTQLCHLRAHTRGCNTNRERITILCEGIDGFLKRCEGLRGSNYDDLGDEDQKLTWTLVNVTKALLSELQKNRKGAAA